MVKRARGNERKRPKPGSMQALVHALFRPVSPETIRRLRAQSRLAVLMHVPLGVWLLFLLGVPSGVLVAMERPIAAVAVPAVFLAQMVGWLALFFLSDRRPPPRILSTDRRVNAVGLSWALLGALTLFGVAVFPESPEPDLRNPKAIISAIRIAQEAHRAETLKYVDASSSPTNWYPSEPTGDAKPFENASHVDAQAWTSLNVVADDETAFGFVTISGKAGSQPPPSPLGALLPWPNETEEPWFVIYAVGFEADTKYYLAASSLSGTIHEKTAAE